MKTVRSIRCGNDWMVKHKPSTVTGFITVKDITDRDELTELFTARALEMNDQEKIIFAEFGQKLFEVSLGLSCSYSGNYEATAIFKCYTGQNSETEHLIMKDCIYWK